MLFFLALKEQYAEALSVYNHFIHHTHKMSEGGVMKSDAGGKRKLRIFLSKTVQFKHLFF